MKVKKLLIIGGVAGGASAVRVADQVRVGRPFGAVDVEEHLVR